MSSGATTTVNAVLAEGESIGYDLKSGDILTTDREGNGGDGANLDDPVETWITTPTGGTVTILETQADPPAAGEFQILGWRVDITAPAATVESPLTLASASTRASCQPGIH